MFTERDLLNEPTTLPVPYVVPDMTGIELPTTPTLFYKLPERMSMWVRNFYKEAYAKIRKVDTKHILCVQQIAEKWGTYNTEHYKHNEKLAKLLKKYAAE